ncbi:MAG: hypothetical protein HW413_1157 [Thermoleophilia bacterium]|nr:hypothetical protein [Thermoleophilia bacterium]
MTGNTTTELARRANDGVEVSLVWSRADGHLAVIVSDLRAGDSFELAACPESALDVFHHPFAYAAFRGVDYALGTCRGAGGDALAA